MPNRNIQNIWNDEEKIEQKCILAVAMNLDW